MTIIIIIIIVIIIIIFIIIIPIMSLSALASIFCIFKIEAGNVMYHKCVLWHLPGVLGIWREWSFILIELGRKQTLLGWLESSYLRTNILGELGRKVILLSGSRELSPTPTPPVAVEPRGCLLTGMKIYMIRRIRKPIIFICENKCADQLCSNLTAVS